MKALSLAGVPAGRRLRLRRVRVGLTQRALGELAGVAVSLVSDVENDVPPGRRGVRGVRTRPAQQLASGAAKMDAALTPLEGRWRDPR